ncbi:MAG TPA: squalene/phytoene synthase family protein [Steroidobacteraceae bacterium]|nr:squalene/phytoene synthase family protein [Steroidobacteraceae bacterium]
MRTSPAPGERAPRDPARYFAWLYSQGRLKAALGLLFALEQEIGAALRPGLDHAVAHARMQWWQEECGRAAAGTPVHPLMRELRTLRPPGGGEPDLAGLTRTALWDLACATFDTRRELSGYCEQWARALTGTACEWSAASAPQALRARRFGERLGAALRELELLEHLHADARTGRLRLPLAELEQAGVDGAALAHLPWPAPLAQLLRARHRVLRQELEACTGQVSAPEQGPLRGLLVWAQYAHRRSCRTERALPEPAKPGRTTLLADAWQAWRGARAAAHGRFQL